jgi:hypothetical protein
VQEDDSDAAAALSNIDPALRQLDDTRLLRLSPLPRSSLSRLPSPVSRQPACAPHSPSVRRTKDRRGRRHRVAWSTLSDADIAKRQRTARAAADGRRRARQFRANNTPPPLPAGNAIIPVPDKEVYGPSPNTEWYLYFECDKWLAVYVRSLCISRSWLRHSPPSQCYVRRFVIIAKLDPNLHYARHDNHKLGLICSKVSPLFLSVLWSTDMTAHQIDRMFHCRP